MRRLTRHLLILAMFTPSLWAQTGFRADPAVPVGVTTNDTGREDREDVEKRWLDLEAEGNNAPSLSISIPTGFSGNGLSLYGGISFVDRVRYSDLSDAAITVGVGGGDPEKYVGFSVSGTAYDVYGSSFGKSFGLHASISRMLTNSLSISLGANNILLSSDAENFQILSAYLAATKVLQLRQSKWFRWASLTLGVGNGAFNSEDKTNEIVMTEFDVPGVDEKNWENFGIFGGFSVAVLPRLNVIANWTGQDLDAGVSVVPFSKMGLVVSAAALDITENAGDGVRWGGNVGYTYQFSK